MQVIDGLLAELESEAETTRRVLERIPQAHLSWKPHPKSMSLGQLALHVATVPGNVAELAAVDTIPEPPAFVQAEAATTAELLPSLADSIVRAKRALGGFDDQRMAAMWRLQSQGRDILAMPRVAFVRAIMLNHWYHHRGQLLVYLRMLNQSVPSVYGPTADENPFAGVSGRSFARVVPATAPSQGGGLSVAWRITGAIDNIASSELKEGRPMVHVALLAKLEAKPGKEDEVAAMLKGALPLANAEPATTLWFALKLGPSTFGIFDAFADDAGRQAHLAGPIAAALMAKAPELLAQPPTIQQVDILAAKLNG